MHSLPDYDPETLNSVILMPWYCLYLLTSHQSCVMEQVVTNIFQCYYTQTTHKHPIQATDIGAFDNLNQYGFGHLSVC